MQLEVGGRKVKLKTSTGVEAGKSALASYEILTHLYKKNPTCKVTLDPNQRIKESDETNNQGNLP